MQHSTHHHQSPTATHRVHIVEYAIVALIATTLLVTRHNNPYVAGALIVVVVIPATIAAAMRLLTQQRPAIDPTGEDPSPATAEADLQAVPAANQDRSTHPSTTPRLIESHRG